MAKETVPIGISDARGIAGLSGGIGEIVARGDSPPGRRGILLQRAG